MTKSKLNVYRKCPKCNERTLFKQNDMLTCMNFASEHGCGYTQRIPQSEADKNYMHSQADQLASAILMPKDETIRMWAASHSVDQLADIFVVPAKAVVIRLEQLGIHA